MAKSAAARFLWSSARFVLLLLAICTRLGAPVLQAATPVDLQPAWLEVRLNGQQLSEPTLAMQGPDGTVYVRMDQLREWRFRLEGLPTVELEGLAYVSLSKLHDVTFTVDPQSYVLIIDADPGRLQPTRISFRSDETGPMTRSSAGGFLNYGLVAQHAAEANSASAVFELGAFSSLGTGTATFVGHRSNAGLKLTRLETGWTFDDVSRMRSVRVGDGFTQGGIGSGPMRFGGLQFARSFDVQPGFVTLPLPSLSGSAALPSVVDVYVNDVLQGRYDAPPGPLQLVDVPVVTGGGEVQLIVRDLLGRETIIRESYYAAPLLLRKGLHDYSYETGFLRQGFGQQSAAYGPLFLSGTHRYGFSDRLTAEGHFELSGDVQTGGVGAGFVWPGVGLVTAGLAASRSPQGVGTLARFGFERRTNPFSVGVVMEFVSSSFTNIASSGRQDRPSTSLQAFAGMPLPFGSAGISYVRRASQLGPDIDIVQANSSIRLGRHWSLNIATRRSFGNRAETAAEIFLALALGERSNASAGVSLEHSHASFLLNLQRNAPQGEGLGYRAAAATGKRSRVDGAIDLKTSSGAYSAELSWVDGDLGTRIVVDGSLGLVDGRLFASRRLDQSFAIVRVGDFPNVRIYADNQLVGRTARNGIAIVPSLRAFESNPLRIELADLPFEAYVAGPDRMVRPYRRSGVSVDFGARRSRNAIVNVRLPGGNPLPAGSVAQVAGNDLTFVSAPGGDIFLTGLQSTNVIVVEAQNLRCSFDLELPKMLDPQPRLGPYTCERSSR